jgi:hypothetical protein
MDVLVAGVVRRYAAERVELERSGRKTCDFELMIAFVFRRDAR